MDNIFDAADLLAIEQDAQSSSSSSSCSHAVGWGSHNAADNIPFNEDNIIINQEEPRPIESQVDDVNPSLLTKQSTQKSLIDNAQESDNDSNDDDSSEDDFLESMLALEKTSSTLAEKEPLQEELESDAKGSGRDMETRNILDESENIAIQLGDSVVKWITRRSDQTEKPKKKQTNVEERPPLLVDGVISCTQITGERQCGRATLPPNSEQRVNLGTMVDCLARYDPDKGAYVLEIVDLDVSGLSTATIPEGDNGDSESEEDDDIAAQTEQPRSTIADPRSRAKQAEKQLRKLKQGRGVRSERKRSKLAPDTKTK